MCSRLRARFRVTDFNHHQGLKFKKIDVDDMRAIAAVAQPAGKLAPTRVPPVRARYGNKEVPDVSFSGQTANMADIDTRAVELGRYFTPSEAEHRTNVCLIGDTLLQQLFLGTDPIGNPFVSATMNSWSSA